MIGNPVLIIGAPRSGTSLLQKLLRGHPAFVSLPSESDMIWDRYCHPALRDWDSESMDGIEADGAIRSAIHAEFERYAAPATTWQWFEKSNLIWNFQRNPQLRKIMKTMFRMGFPILRGLARGDDTRRLIEKTASNCFRLEFVNSVFPDARFVYVTRNAQANVNSLINAWRHPTRFFTYNVPEELEIPGYPYDRWKFVLPPGWRGYVRRPLEEVCAFQWAACHDAVMRSFATHEFAGRVLKIKLEDLTARPPSVLKEIADFIGVAYDDYFRQTAAHLPVVNSADNDTRADKWKSQNHDLIQRIVPIVEPMMQRLGYGPPA
jgi:hypothetical protein